MKQEVSRREGSERSEKGGSRLTFDLLSPEKKDAEWF